MASSLRLAFYFLMILYGCFLLMRGGIIQVLESAKNQPHVFIAISPSSRSISLKMILAQAKE